MSITTIDSSSQAVAVILPAEVRRKFQQQCKRRGVSMAERAKQLVVADVSSKPAPSQKFEQLLKTAETINETSKYPEPSMQEIDEFIAQVRKERASTLAG